jgi:signal transduction histidine kinase
VERDQNGEPASMAGICMDISARRRVEDENQRLYAEAERANRLKDEFLATLSHELRTPLNVIAGRARMLASIAESEQVRAIAGVIDRNSTTLTRLVDDLLDMSRMTIGQVRLERQVVALAPVVTAAVQAVQPSADAKGISVSCVVDPDAVVLGDPVRLQQVTWNLLTNAVKFTPAGGRVSVTGQVTGGGVSLVVRDSGLGLSADMLPRVFDMFWQAEPAGTRQYNGLGLGLSLVKRLAELHGGHVTVASDGIGHGATFTVTLPKARPPA